MGSGSGLRAAQFFEPSAVEMRFFWLVEEDSVALEQTLTDISICTRCSCSAGVFGDAHSLGVMLVDGEMRWKGFRESDR